MTALPPKRSMVETDTAFCPKKLPKRPCDFMVKLVPAFKFLYDNAAESDERQILAAYAASVFRNTPKLKVIYADLGLPWSIRMIGDPSLINFQTLRAAAALPPTVFSRTLPRSRPHPRQFNPVIRWAVVIANALDRKCVDSAVVWVAENYADVSNEVLDYLKTVDHVAHGTSVETVKNRSKQWHREQVVKAQAENREANRRLFIKTRFEDALQKLHYGNYHFVLIDDQWTANDEAVAMENCINDRFELERTRTVFFSVRDHDGKRVANAQYAIEAEYDLDKQETVFRLERLKEIKGPRDGAVAPDVMYSAETLPASLDRQVIARLPDVAQGGILPEAQCQFGMPGPSPRKWITERLVQHISAQHNLLLQDISRDALLFGTAMPRIGVDRAADDRRDVPTHVNGPNVDEVFTRETLERAMKDARRDRDQRPPQQRFRLPRL